MKRIEDDYHDMEIEKLEMKIKIDDRPFQPRHFLKSFNFFRYLSNRNRKPKTQ